jgi:hypothetical protein
VKHVLSYGLGRDSSWVLAKWCRDPDSCDFDLEDDLIVITANTGNEYRSTRRTVEQYIFPLLRKHHIRFVEVSRAGPATSDGYAVLTDTREPTMLHAAGPWTITDEYTASGSVVQQSNRRCSQRFKGEVIDAWIRDELGDEPYIHYIGFALGEENRSERDAKCYGGGAGREPRYPLQTWNVTSERAAELLLEEFGVTFEKSACVRCPFACSTVSAPLTAARWAAEPDTAANVVVDEHRALAFNPRAAVFGSKTLKSGEVRNRTAAAFVDEFSLDQVRAVADDTLATMAWDVVLIRRLSLPAADDNRTVLRSLTILATAPDRTVADEHLQYLLAATPEADAVTDEHGLIRAWLRRPDPDADVQTSEFYTIAPTGALTKQRSAFAWLWAVHVPHTPWDLLRIRRLALPAASGRHSVRNSVIVLDTVADRAAAEQQLQNMFASHSAAMKADQHGLPQAWPRRPDAGADIQADEYFTIAPVGTLPRTPARFEQLWSAHVLHQQDALFDQLAAA